MRDYSLDIPGLLGARLCHDLISPVGAISNGLELLQLSGDLNGPERDLIADSAASASGRLQMFRLAFGRASGGQLMSAADIRLIVQNYAQGTDVQFIWHGDADVDRDQAKMAVLILMCLETIIGRAGHVEARQTEKGWIFLATAKRPVNATAAFSALLDGSDWPYDLSPADVHFPLARLACEGLRKTLQAETGDQSVTITVNRIDLPGAANVNREQSRRLLQDI